MTSFSLLACQPERTVVEVPGPDASPADAAPSPVDAGAGAVDAETCPDQPDAAPDGPGNYPFGAECNLDAGAEPCNEGLICFDFHMKGKRCTKPCHRCSECTCGGAGVCKVPSL